MSSRLVTFGFAAFWFLPISGIRKISQIYLCNFCLETIGNTKSMMKVAAIVFASVLAVSFGQDSNPQGCINASDFSADFDYFPDKVSANYSDYWDIKYFKTYKILRNEIAGTSYVL